jgi:hypothetical protein
MRKLRIFDDGSYVAAETGRIDDWRISIYDANGTLIRTPTDSYCLDYFLRIGRNQEVFSALVEMAKEIGKDEGVVARLKLPSFDGTIEEQRLFAAYAAMLVAEENRIITKYGRNIPTKLGKKIKIVGAYQALLEGMSPAEAARWSVDRPWQEIAAKYEQLSKDY